MKGFKIILAMSASALSTSAALAQAVVPAPGDADAQSSAPAPSEPPVAAAAAPSDSAVGDIVVTANKRSERLSRVPISITAASGEQLSNLGITSPQGLEKITPGLTFTQSNYGASVYTLRGVGGFVEALAFAPTVSVYVDQVPLPFSRLTEGASLDPERVEVLKGPQGTLFGQNSTGGAINYIAAKPTDTLKAGADLTYGRFDEVDVGGYVSGPLTDTLKARLAFRSEHRSAWQYNYVDDPAVTPFGSSNKNGVRDFSVARLLVDWNPTSDLSVELNVNGWFDKSDMQQKQYATYLPLVPGGADRVIPGVPSLQAALQNYPLATGNSRAAGFDPGLSNRRDDSFYQAALKVEYNLSSRVQLTSISSYSHSKTFGPTDLDGTIYPVSRNNIVGSFDVYSQELRLAGSLFPDDRLKWLVGGNYEYDKVNDTANLYINTTNSGIPIPAGATTQVGGVPQPDGSQVFYFNSFQNLANQKIKTAAVFGGLTFALTDRITLEGSARYTDRRDKYEGCLIEPFGPTGAFARTLSALSQALTGAATPPVAGPQGCITLNSSNTFFPGLIHQDLNEHNFSYRGSVSWRPTDAVMLYANVTKGFKAGAFENLSAVSVSQTLPVKQESVLAYETGLKSFWFNRALQIDVAGFYYDYRAKQIADYVTNFVFGTLPSLVSIPKSRITGFETSITARPVQGLSLNTGVTYVNSKVLSHYLTPGLIGVAQDIKGDALPLTPKWQISANGDYEAPVSDSLKAFVGASAVYHSRATPAFVSGSFNLPSYVVLDLRAGVETQDGRYRLEVWGKNVTNKYYLTTFVHTGDTLSTLTGMPATYGLTFKFRLD
ncbi:TonB-dependent receptor [Sphingomonas gei]|nr:TonB-dependent receptor [Sphingomonas gei]